MTVTADLLKPGAEALATLVLALGLVELALTVPCLIAPVPLCRFWRRYPRRVWPGRVLSAIALIWAALWLQAMPLGTLTPLKRFLPILITVSVLAVWFLADELLACRAVGGLMVLLPAPLLSAAQWHPSPWRLVILLAAYAIAVAGMIVVAAPYRLRDALHWATETPGRLRALAAAEGAFGLVLVVLAVTAFPLSPHGS